MKYAFAIAATHSGTGKTTISLGLMAFFIKKGYTVQSFKIGPDFIDPGLHRAVTDRTSWNLDRWMCGDEYIRKLFNEKSSDADISIIEGVMGLFDGGYSSTAEVSKTIGIPIILVLDIKGMAESAAALTRGFETFDKDINIAGVILNRVGSKRHFNMVKYAIEKNSAVNVIGYLPYDMGISIPERHLGLYTAEEGIIKEAFLNTLITIIENNIDIKSLVSSYKISTFNKRLLKRKKHKSKNINLKSKIPLRLAVAYDRAFCFYYEDNFELLKNKGVEIIFFSPINDSAIPDGIEGLYIGGGYPELYADKLSSNTSMLSSIRNFVESGGITYAECGGFMYLTEGIYDIENRYLPLTAIYPVKSRMRKIRKSLGYREVELNMETILGKKGDLIRGHEYHYSEIEKMPSHIKRVYNSKDNSEGYVINNCLASYVHIHFGSNTNIVQSLLSKLSH